MAQVDARLRVTGPATHNNTVPAEVLVRVIEGMQQSVWLLAAAAEVRTLRRRFKPAESLRHRFTLRIAVPERGSYAMPLSLVDEGSQALLGGSAVGDDLLRSLAKVWDAISSDDLLSVRSILADQGYLVRVLHEFRRILPRQGDGWGVAFAANGTPEVELGARHRPIVDRWLESPTEKKETSVIGELLRIDFASERLWILYPPTQREIECSYREEIEDTIVEARRGLFQVTGRFVLDSDGHPKQLIDVREIEPVDTSPVKLSEVQLEGGTLAFDPPFVLAPELDPEGQQYFVAAVDELGLTICGRTRDALIEDFNEQLAYAWREYGLADTNELTQDACELRTQLLARVRPVKK